VVAPLTGGTIHYVSTLKAWDYKCRPQKHDQSRRGIDAAVEAALRKVLSSIIYASVREDVASDYMLVGSI
jgi:hypothetical protein